MNIKNDWPPNIAAIKKAFAVPAKTFFTYGNTLYNPDNAFVDDILLAHEAIHAKQQASPEDWWERYLIDADFRLSQEVPAYQAQYKMAVKTLKDRNALFKYVHKMAMDLAGPMYGDIISYQEALRAIKNPKPYVFNAK